MLNELSQKEISDNETNELIIAQQNQILLEISNSQPLIGLLVSPSVLIEDYEKSNSPGFVPGLKYLAQKYLIRKVRGDGNCFYRSLLFSYLERLLTDYNSEDTNLKQISEKEHARMLEKLKSSKQDLITLGYSEIAFESFYDVRYVNPC